MVFAPICDAPTPNWLSLLWIGALGQCLAVACRLRSRWDARFACSPAARNHRALSETLRPVLFLSPQTAVNLSEMRRQASPQLLSSLHAQCSTGPRTASHDL